MNIRSDLLQGPPPDPPVEFYRLPKSGQRDPYFGFSRSWYYKAAATGEIDLVSLRQRNALRGVRLIVYDSVVGYIRRSIADQISSGPSRPPSPEPVQAPFPDAQEKDAPLRPPPSCPRAATSRRPE